MSENKQHAEHQSGKKKQSKEEKQRAKELRLAESLAKAAARAQSVTSINSVLYRSGRNERGVEECIAEYAERVGRFEEEQTSEFERQIVLKRLLADVHVFYWRREYPSCVRLLDCCVELFVLPASQSKEIEKCMVPSGEFRTQIVDCFARCHLKAWEHAREQKRRHEGEGNDGENNKRQHNVEQLLHLCVDGKKSRGTPFYDVLLCKPSTSDSADKRLLLQEEFRSYGAMVDNSQSPVADKQEGFKFREQFATLGLLASFYRQTDVPRAVSLYCLQVHLRPPCVDAWRALGELFEALGTSEEQLREVHMRCAWVCYEHALYFCKFAINEHDHQATMRADLVREQYSEALFELTDYLSEERWESYADSVLLAARLGANETNVGEGKQDVAAESCSLEVERLVAGWEAPMITRLLRVFQVQTIVKDFSHARVVTKESVLHGKQQRQQELSQTTTTTDALLEQTKLAIQNNPHKAFR